MKRIIGLLGALAVSACSISVDGEKYLDAGAPFNLFNFFEGDVRGWGIVQDRDGNLLQRFIVDIDGKVRGDTITLDETFNYSIGDGVTKRLWTITDTGDNTFEGGAADIAGPAKGTSFGNAFYWRYEMDLPVDNTTYRVNFQDWMWAFDENTIMNRSYIKKFGIVFAEVTIFMQKQ
ncbi:DUF3833 domain-containing protein [Kordiimonas aquimaris]|uniref:DUF3833 domain-containing protein n=1 Tax=Kordiimonas aquimaris TaxID=707591 RepID=UPI0021D2567D|nr:DUF3833 domain-containing protein [Kordiimonas aquimaris]